jgi:integrase
MVVRERETVAEFLRRWLAFKRTDGTAPKTLQGYEDHIEKRWIPAIGQRRMTDLYANPRLILDAQTDWLTNGVETRNRGRRVRRIIPSHVTVGHYRATLNAALEDNRRWHNNTVPNPSEIVGAKPSLESTEEIVTLTADEARALIVVARDSDDMRAQAALFALHMGMRPGEVYGLRRRDVGRSYIYVRQTVAKLRKRGVVVQEHHAKNRNSMAPVELTAGAAQVLAHAAGIQSEQIKAAGTAWTDQSLVFTDPLGGPLDEQDVRRHFAKLLEQAGVTRIKVKDLRHTHATLLIENDVHPKFVSQRLRHSRIGVTMDTYSHVMPPMRSAAASRFDVLVGTADTAESSDLNVVES